MSYLETVDPYEDAGITADELTDKTEVDSQPVDTNKEIAATESFDYYQGLGNKKNAQMGANALLMQQQQRLPFSIRTSDGKNFRIYFRSDTLMMPREVNLLCRFIDMRKPGETVTFVLGVELEDNQTQLLGPIISSIISCPGTVNTIAAGMCSLSETMIWCFGKNREMYRYGALIFSKPEFLTVCKEYKNYYDVVYTRAKEIGVITDEQIKHIFSTNEDLMLMYSDVVKQ